VKPGAQTDKIRLGYRGAKGISLDRNGALLVNTSLGTLHDDAPVSYQQIDNARVPVQSRYVLRPGSDEYSFAIEPAYRKDQELVIDPGVEYSTYLGGASNDVPTGVAVDSAGNAYVVGWTQSPDFPVTAGAFSRTGAASNFSDVFVAKVNPSGTALIYSTFIGGSNLDFGRAIAIDAAGNAYVAGLTKSANFPVTGNAFQRSLAHLNCPRCDVDNSDAFVTKLNPTGSALVYSTYLGGATSIDDALGIAVEGAGSAYVVGETSSTDFPTTAGAFRRSNSGGDDAYVTKLNPSGSALVYSTLLVACRGEFVSMGALVDGGRNTSS
jgi:Beta-propeller repeat